MHPVSGAGPDPPRGIDAEAVEHADGRIRENPRSGFHAFVKERPVPLWTQLGAEEVRVLDGGLAPIRQSD